VTLCGVCDSTSDVCAAVRICDVCVCVCILYFFLNVYVHEKLCLLCVCDGVFVCVSLCVSVCVG